MKTKNPLPISYDPNNLFDKIIERLGLKTDAALCRVIGVAPPVISKMRHHVIPIGSDLLVRLHDATQLPIDDLRELMGVQRKRAQP